MVRRLFNRIIMPIDGFLLIVLLVLMTLGLFVLYSATDQNLDKVLSQAMNIGVALTALWLFANLPPRHLLRLAVPSYLAGIVLLITVALFGEVSHGARRWLHFGIIRIQPSELMKLAVPLMLAWFFEYRQAALRLRDFAWATALLMVPVVLIAKQPDLGTALLILASGFYVMFLAGLGWKVMGTITLLITASAPILWSLLRDYQRQRILTLIDPSRDPLGAGYHIIQSTIAIGSGGWLGKGWLHGTQAHLNFLPEQHTDFIFAVIAEEFGLAGNLLLLLLYLLLISRGLSIATNASSMFTRLLAGSITLTFATYAFVNIGMVSGILPVVGVPLPLISYGGTSMVTLLVGFGILMSIENHQTLMKA